MTPNNPDDFDGDDLAELIRNHANRPRERKPRPPTLKDSALWHQIAGQTGTLTNAQITADGVTVETAEITVARPLLGPIERNPE